MIDISNRIWLCQSCSKLIEADPKKYPIDLLVGSFNPDSIFSMAIDNKLSDDLEINKDAESTILTRKMKDGEFDTILILNAKGAKLHALSIIKILKTTQAGKNVIMPQQLP